jgi:hypothetical protein
VVAAVVVPRGIRNMNPSNLEYGPFARKYGATASDGRFAIFTRMQDGIRCAAENLIAYNELHGINTVRGTIERWAPSNENQTEAYIALVCDVCEVNADDHLDFHSSDTLYWLLTAIFEEENGHTAATQYITDTDMDAGINAALA